MTAHHFSTVHYCVHVLKSDGQLLFTIFSIGGKRHNVVAHLDEKCFVIFLFVDGKIALDKGDHTRSTNLLSAL